MLDRGLARTVCDCFVALRAPRNDRMDKELNASFGEDVEFDVNLIRGAFEAEGGVFEGVRDDIYAESPLFFSSQGEANAVNGD